jgi:ZIP family zinc transporter
VSLLVGIAILAFAVFVGGLAALWRERGRRAVPAIRTFAVVAAVAIALFHLLPEAISSAGWLVLVATAIGAFGPAALERLIPSERAHTHDAPTTALAMGYAAVIAHQAGEGAALASLAGTGALSAAIVLAIAAHTVPLAMVVAIRVLEVRAGPGAKHATFLALAGVALATVAGALGGNLLGAARLTAVQPWILATVAGLLLHALSHDVLEPASQTRGGRVADMLAGWAGLVLAMLGTEEGGWIDRVPVAFRVSGFVALAGVIAARSFWKRAPAAGHDHPH